MLLKNLGNAAYDVWQTAESNLMGCDTCWRIGLGAEGVICGAFALLLVRTSTTVTQSIVLICYVKVGNCFFGLSPYVAVNGLLSGNCA